MKRANRKFAEAADQALLILDRIIYDYGKLHVDDPLILTPCEIRLVLVYTYDEKRTFDKTSNLKLFANLMELDDLARQADINSY